MGADAFIAFYGIRFEIGDADAIDQLNDANDRRLANAKRGKLDVYTGRLTDGEPHFLLIGKNLGVFGVENETQKEFDAAELAELARVTTAKLQSCGFTEPPRFWFQLNAQY